MNHTTQLSDRRSAHGGNGAATAVPPPAAARAGRRPASQQWAAWGFLAPVTLYLALFYAYPLYRNIDLSLRNYTVRSFVQGDAPFTGPQNYLTVFDDPTFAPALFHTVVFTAVCLVAQYTLGLVLAVFFNQHFRLSATLRALFLVPWLLPLIVSASTWSWMLNSDSGVVNALLGAVGIGPVNWLTSPSWSLTSVIIANIWIGVPFNLVVLYSGLQSIPASLYEAAALDGANAWQRFWRITFPLLRPVSAITLLLGLVYTLKVFDIIWIMTKGGPADSSTTFATWSYQLGFGNLLPAFGPGAAVGNLLVVAALVFGLIYVKVQRKQALS
ncbi:ABC transporter permease [Streptomyces viridochromogenes]|uniref:ABC transporter permease n=1 Tax=Streptomyces viridochromogenes TaxID=1938 RepID=A0A0J7ZJX2_STRVR|nr:sugar ABC transporter permease [Streptomyces viridochromogenes]KMS76179.1 ABC transporter permease [Streptomyces viridochromogenes]KOG25008.1 ABC transporter permease [Streptomyces viridochromogenes]KOG26475.1 ABC transporter permease [Streptomyces viridochromogenes]